MTITRALIIAEPWIDLLLSGKKVWEMRSTTASLRGWFGLIRRGSGEVVGIARLVDVGEPLSQQEMLATIEKHQISEEIIRSGQVSSWCIPWKLADVRPLAKPVSYREKNGAVRWVVLDGGTVAAIEAEMRTSDPASD